MALQKQNFNIPISLGLDQKTDPFQVETGRALRLENARFYKTGKLSKRFGLVQMPVATSSGDLDDKTLSCIASDSSQLNVVASDGVYSYMESFDEWKKISDVRDFAKINTEFLSKSSLNQYNPDCDFSSEFNLFVSVYREREELDALKPTSTEKITICLEDTVTGVKQLESVILTAGAFTSLGQNVVIVNDNGAPKIHVFIQRSTDILRVVYDKYLNVLVGLSSLTPSGYIGGRSKVQTLKDSSNVYMVSMAGTTIAFYKYTLGGTLSTNTTHTTTNRLGFATTSGYGLGFSCYLSGSTIHVFYITNSSGEVGTGIVGVGFNTSFTNTITESSLSVSDLRNISIVTSGSNVICAVQRVEGPTYSLRNSTVKKYTAAIGASYTITIDTFDSTFTVGSRLELIGRPFVINGVNYCICKSCETDQRTGFVYNLDQRKASASFSPFSLSNARGSDLPTQSIQFCSNSVVNNGVVYTSLEKIYGLDTDSVVANDFIANQAITKLMVDFNSSAAVRTRAKVGETIYLTDGRTYCFDARGCYESGFDLAPKINSATANTTAGTNPDISSKTFNYVAIYTFYNAKGEIERSIPSQAVSITTPSNTSYIEIDVKCIAFSYKSEVDAIGVNNKQTIDIVLYRTAASGSVFYRVGNVANRPINYSQTLFDAVSDANITNNELLYTDGGIIESDSTPNARFSASGGNRLFLGGLEENDEIAYSQKQLFAEGVSFSDFFRLRVSTGTSADRSPISAIGYMDNKLIVFRKNSIYFIQGDGPNEAGVGSFTEPEVISSDVGCTEPRSVITTPMGLLFKSAKGIYLLTRSLSVEYKGAPVEDFNQFTVIAAVVSDKFNEARFYLSNGTAVVYNFLFDAWSTFTSQSFVDADIWASTPVSIKSNSVFKETENTFQDGTSYYSMTYGTPWLKPDLLQGYFRVYRLYIIGSNKSSHTLKLRIYTDYDDSTYEEYSLVLNTSEQPQYQFQVHMTKQKVESIRFELFDTDHANLSTGEAYDLSNIQIEMGIKAGGFKLAATKQY